MKRILSLTLSLALVALVSSVVIARPTDMGDRPMIRMAEQNIQTAQTADSRPDTLWLFAASGDGAFGMPGTDERGYNFDGDGTCEAAGWYGVDLTTQEGIWWHVADAHLVDNHDTDISAAAPFDPADTVNDYALWIGRENVCGWCNTTGYGNGWDQWVEVPTGGEYDLVTIDFAYVGDFEGDVWDYFQVLIQGADDEWYAVYENNITGEKLYQDLALSVTPADIGSESLGDVAFRFLSDGAWSDQDCLFETDIGAVWLDNIVVTADGTTIVEADFEDGLEPAGINLTMPAGAGDFADLYTGLFTEDICVINNSCAWAFFDLATTNPNYPIPVIVYGPPYLNNVIQSPLLEVDHNGDPVNLTAETTVFLECQAYWDLELNPLIFFYFDVSVQTVELPCLGGWYNDNTVYYGPYKQWFDFYREINEFIANSAQGGTVNGIALRFGARDMCEYWCSQYGDGTNHPPGPFVDNIHCGIITASAVDWTISTFHRLQDNFPAAGSPTVRIDSAYNVEPGDSPTVVVGDSVMIGLNMDLLGGIATTFNSDAGEDRPELYMWFRVVDGPNAGSTDAAMCDQDDLDGIYSPYAGVQNFDGDDWVLMQVDSAAYQGNVQPGKWAFDFNDGWFEPGDVIDYFYRAEAVNGTIETAPSSAMWTDPMDRGYYAVRCLPTAGSTMLFCEDDSGIYPFWREAFTYSGYTNYDIYTTQAPSSGLNNGLAGRAEVGDLDQYQVVVWDSGNLPSYTITNDEDDKVFDSDLLADFLSNSTHSVYLWVMGDRIGDDMGIGDPFLYGELGANLLDDANFYDDYTGLLVPMVYGDHSALQYLGGSPTFWVHGGCPVLQNFNVVTPNGSLAETSHNWEEAVSGIVAGILQNDPDGNGTSVNPSGYTSKALYNPFSYYHVRDAGYAHSANEDYARLYVGQVLANLFGHLNDSAPDDAPGTPGYTRLEGNFPNPFNPKTTISFSIGSSEHVNLAVYDLTGRLVKTLVDETMPAQQHAIVWDGTDNGGDRVASGVYFYKLNAGDYSATDKMVVLK